MFKDYFYVSKSELATPLVSIIALTKDLLQAEFSTFVKKAGSNDGVRWTTFKNLLSGHLTSNITPGSNTKKLFVNFFPG